MEQTSLLMLVFWASVGAVGLVMGVWVLRWLLGVNEILNRIKELHDELEALREQQVAARSSFAARSDVSEPEVARLDMPIPDDWRLGRNDE
jgi:hypothetical protein